MSSKSSFCSVLDRLSGSNFCGLLNFVHAFFLHVFKLCFLCHYVFPKQNRDSNSGSRSWLSPYRAIRFHLDPYTVPSPWHHTMNTLDFTEGTTQKAYHTTSIPLSSRIKYGEGESIIHNPRRLLFEQLFSCWDQSTNLKGAFSTSVFL